MFGGCSLGWLSGPVDTGQVAIIMRGFVYILLSRKNNTFYIGSTSDVDRRINEHFLGKSVYTREVLPLERVFTQEYPLLSTARKVERWLKNQKDRNLVERIIKEGRIVKTFE